jgi:hypothetical protein
VIYDRRSRFLPTGLYDLPLGHNKMFLASGDRFVQGLVSGWQIGGVFIWQTGPFLTPYEQSDDPAATNMVNVVGYTRPDRAPPTSFYAHGSQDGNPLFLNSSAFTLPGSNIVDSATQPWVV